MNTEEQKAYDSTLEGSVKIIKSELMSMNVLMMGFLELQMKTMIRLNRSFKIKRRAK